MQKIPKKNTRKKEKSSSIDSVVKDFCQSKTLINHIIFLRKKHFSAIPVMFLQVAAKYQVTAGGVGTKFVS